MEQKNCMVKVLLLALLVLTSHSSFCQEGSKANEPKQAQIRVLKLHPLQIGEVYLSYEKMRTKRTSNEVGLSYVYRSYLEGDKFIPDPDGVSVKGLHLRMSEHYYTSKKHDGVPLGFFHGPLFGYRLTIFEKNTLMRKEPAQDPSSLGRMSQHALELNYQAGGQFKLSQHLTMEVSAALGGRLKYVRAENAGKLLTEYIIGHALLADKNAAMLIVPSPQLNLSVGYSF